MKGKKYKSEIVEGWKGKRRTKRKITQRRRERREAQRRETQEHKEKGPKRRVQHRGNRGGRPDRVGVNAGSGDVGKTAERSLDCATRRAKLRREGKNRVAPLGMTFWVVGDDEEAEKWESGHRLRSGGGWKSGSKLPFVTQCKPHCKGEEDGEEESDGGGGRVRGVHAGGTDRGL